MGPLVCVCVFFPSPFCRKSRLGIFFKMKFIMDIVGGFSLFSIFKKQKNREEIEKQRRNKHTGHSSTLESILRAGLLNFLTRDNSSQMLPCFGRLLCTMWLYRISGLNPLDVGSPSPVRTTRNVSRHCQSSSWRENGPS